jgi:hypothetical protein
MLTDLLVVALAEDRLLVDRERVSTPASHATPACHRPRDLHKNQAALLIGLGR